jgi:putative membrane protein
MMGWYPDGMGWGGWVVMSLVMVAFWGLVIWGVVAIFRGTTRDTGSAAGPGRRDPVEILDERFARGEIDVDEYHARLDVLRSSVR